MNWNLIEINWKHFRSAVVEYWVWFIDEHVEGVESTRRHFEDKTYVINNDEAEMQ